MNVTMPCSVNAVPCLIITTLTLLGSASAQTTRTFTDFSFTTLTTLGYTLTQLLEPTTLSYTPYTLATPLVCPEGYGTLRGDLCLGPNTGYSPQAPSSPPPITITTTIPGQGFVAVGSTSVPTTVPQPYTLTVSNYYCPTPYTLFGGVCVTAASVPSYEAAYSAEIAIYYSTHTQGIPIATLTTLGETITYYSTPGVVGQTSLPAGGPSATITTAGMTVTLYTPPVLPSVSGQSTMMTSATTTALVSQSSDGQVEAITSAATSTTVAPFNGEASKRVASVGTILAVVAAAVGAGIVIVL